MIIQTPRQLVAALPHLIGFHPHVSLVIVVFDDKEVKAITRMDWPIHQIALPIDIEHAMRSSQEPSVVLMAYTDAEVVLEQVVDLISGASDLELLDVLWIHDDRWTSLMCEDIECCPVDGHSLHDASETEVEFIISGSAPFASRDDLVDALRASELTATEIQEREHAEAKVRRQISTMLKQAEQHHDSADVPADEDAEGEAGEPDSQLSLVKPEVLASQTQTVSEIRKTVSVVRSEIVQDVVKRLRNSRVLSWEDLAWLTGVVNDIRMRDGLLRSLFDQREVRPHARSLLMIAVSKASVKDVPALATVLAGCAWLDGNGAMATVAIARALEVDPSYSLGRLLDRAISHGVPPSVWSDSLEAVSYDECLTGAA